MTIISSEYTFKLDFIKQCKNLFSQKPKAVILCRFINNLSFEIIKNCKVNNIKTIFFIDDYLYSVPEFIKKEKYSSKIFKNQFIANIPTSRLHSYKHTCTKTKH